MNKKINEAKNTLLRQKKFYVFLIPLGISILFSTLAIGTECILKVKKNMLF